MEQRIKVLYNKGVSLYTLGVKGIAMEESNKKDVSKRLRKMRESLGYTQEAFAEFLDISISLYKKMESGENNVSRETLIKMRQVLHFSTDYLLFGESDTFVEVWEKTLGMDSKQKMLLFMKLFSVLSKDGYATVKSEDEKIIKKIEKVISEENDPS